MRHIYVLSEAASSQPQLAFAVLSLSLQHEWTFLLRVVPQCDQLFQELDFSLSSRFLPAMFGVEVSTVERCLFVIPLRLGGLGICNPVALASHLFNLSVGGTKHLVRSIAGLESFELDSHLDCVSSSKQFYHHQLGVTFSEQFGQLFGLFDSMQQRAILQAKDGNISHGCLFCFWVEVSLICQHKSLGMVLLCITGSHCYPYLLCVMVVEHHSVLSIPLIVTLGAWSLVGIMRLGMHSVTLLLWFGHQLLRNQLCVMDMLVLIH